MVKLEISETCAKDDGEKWALALGADVAPPEEVTPEAGSVMYLAMMLSALYLSSRGVSFDAMHRRTKSSSDSAFVAERCSETDADFEGPTWTFEVF